MTSQHRETTELAKRYPNKLYWIDSTKYCGYGIIFINDTILDVRVSDNTIVIGHSRKYGFQRLFAMVRTMDNANDIRFAIKRAIELN